ncbi:MAG: IPT/TIG domain-containing protein [Candidatus Hydrogenedentes bacterium]|nr:IPT/TIG domain-containing protein [Candidatus Hydrogenedentota bacterium]
MGNSKKLVLASIVSVMMMLSFALGVLPSQMENPANSAIASAGASGVAISANGSTPIGDRLAIPVGTEQGFTAISLTDGVATHLIPAGEADWSFESDGSAALSVKPGDFVATVRALVPGEAGLYLTTADGQVDVVNLIIYDPAGDETDVGAKAILQSATVYNIYIATSFSQEFLPFTLTTAGNFGEAIAYYVDTVVNGIASGVETELGTASEPPYALTVAAQAFDLLNCSAKAVNACNFVYYGVDSMKTSDNQYVQSARVAIDQLPSEYGPFPNVLTQFSVTGDVYTAYVSTFPELAASDDADANLANGFQVAPDFASTHAQIAMVGLKTGVKSAGQGQILKDVVFGGIPISTAGLDSITLQDPADPTRILTVIVTPGLVLPGEIGVLVLGVADDPALLGLPDLGTSCDGLVCGPLVEKGRYVEISILISSDGGATFSEVPSSRFDADSNVSILMEGLVVSAGASASFFSYPSDVSVVDAFNLGLSATGGGVWTPVSGSLVALNEMAVILSSGLSVFAPFSTPGALNIAAVRNPDETTPAVDFAIGGNEILIDVENLSVTANVEISIDGIVVSESAARESLPGNITRLHVNTPRANDLVSPAPSAVVAVTVTNLGGAKAGETDTEPAGLIYFGPIITSVTPNSGTVLGGDAITVAGSGFDTAGITASLGGSAVANVNVTSDLEFTGDTTAHAAGLVALDVTTSNNFIGSLADAFEYVACNAALITGLVPDTGPETGGTVVTITGEAFTPAKVLTVTFDAIAAIAVTYIDYNTITATTPAHAPGTVDVAVTTDCGTTTATGAFTYTACPVPTITAVDPVTGSTAGGTTVTITGTGFLEGAKAVAVLFDVDAATNVTVVNDTTITAVTPAHAAVAVDVTVLSACGQDVLAGGFTYVAPCPVPTIAAVDPATGLTAGGESVTITGTGFLEGAKAVSVLFGTDAATNVTVVNDTNLTAVTPAHAAGAVDVTLNTACGSDVLVAGFTYQAPCPVPTITAVNPNQDTVNGGATVTITGTGFLEGAKVVSVLFGTDAATNVQVTNDTTLTAVTPAHAAGIVDVTVVTACGQATLTGGFTFILACPPPGTTFTVDSATPNSGPATGGNQVVVAGTGWPTIQLPAVQTSGTVFRVGQVAAPQGGTADIPVTLFRGTDAGPAAASIDVTILYDDTILRPKQPGIRDFDTDGDGDVDIDDQDVNGDGVIISDPNDPNTDVVELAFRDSAALKARGKSGTITTGTSGRIEMVIAGGTTTLGTIGSEFSLGTLLFEEVLGTTGQTTLLDVQNLSMATAGAVALADAHDQDGYFEVGTAITTGLEPLQVFFGANEATVVSNNGVDQVTVTVPAGTASTTVDIRVEEAADPANFGVLCSGYSYVALPCQIPVTVTSVTPNVGPTAGSTAVIIAGTGFSEAKAVSVTFGGVVATNIVVNSDIELTAVTPAHAAGAVDVTVTTSCGSATLTAGFTYEGVCIPPTVTAVNPNSGSVNGGLQVEITGTALTGATAVTFGGTAAASFTVNSATPITAVTPPHPEGPVDVSVTTCAVGTLAGGFTYNVTGLSITDVQVNGNSVRDSWVIGGVVAHVIGTGLNSAKAPATITFGAVPAELHGATQTDTELVVIIPVYVIADANAANEEVVVRATAGGQTASLADPFTFHRFATQGGITVTAFYFEGSQGTANKTVFFPPDKAVNPPLGTALTSALLSVPAGIANETVFGLARVTKDPANYGIDQVPATQAAITNVWAFDVHLYTEKPSFKSALEYGADLGDVKQNTGVTSSDLAYREITNEPSFNTDAVPATLDYPVNDTTLEGAPLPVEAVRAGAVATYRRNTVLLDYAFGVSFEAQSGGAAPTYESTVLRTEFDPEAGADAEQVINVRSRLYKFGASVLRVVVNPAANPADILSLADANGNSIAQGQGDVGGGTNMRIRSTDGGLGYPVSVDFVAPGTGKSVKVFGTLVNAGQNEFELSVNSPASPLPGDGVGPVDLLVNINAGFDNGTAQVKTIRVANGFAYTKAAVTDGTGLLLGLLAALAGIFAGGKGGGGGGGPCFIATAAYGTPLADDIGTLRVLRDTFLLNNAVGSAFVDAYYHVSPAIADVVAQSPLLAALVRLILVPVVFVAKLVLAMPVVSLALSTLLFAAATLWRRKRSRA